MTIVEKLTAQKTVCPWWLCFTFDNPARRLIHKPLRMLHPYVHPGDTVIDLGCGMGFFTVPIAMLVGSSGRVIAVDVQERMLAALRRRGQKKGLLERITTHLAGSQSIGLDERADFILIFWMLHEVPGQEAFLAEVKKQLKPGGMVLLVEPIIHVPSGYFSRTLRIAADQGFIVKERPEISFSHSALLSLD